ncbi:TetR/AcrR family transcriptional regulator [Deinococcus roseus]|uniref:TetR family transcriptional regulator n=1 Tax=Deinococcus roseus TaxID=392414 RepID=A0ABQ2D5Z6_9DEIO|nr:TetR/AcrR family transcriptional regulator C-terminal domain-containing protein [Deinococcus roseus]GGJ46691.1 TetR family transcriptional regulator [Deinococcus roseus]
MPRPPKNHTSRLPLTRERALQVAVQLADQGGLEALTMRKLAQTLGVEAMSLYHHIPGKEDILDGMVEQIFADMAWQESDPGWKGTMRNRAYRMREVLLLHPWATALMVSRSRPGAMTLRHLNDTLGCLRAGGFSVALAAHALSLLDSYIYGFVMQEVQLPFQNEAEKDQMVTGVLQHMPADVYPHFVELTLQQVVQPGYRYGSEFDYGIELLLDSLELQLQAEMEKQT